MLSKPVSIDKNFACNFASVCNNLVLRLVFRRNSIMKKHILGFAIFSLIVGTAVFVSAFVYKQVKREYVYEISERSCWKQVKQKNVISSSKVKIVQAVFNTYPKFSELNLELSTNLSQPVEIQLFKNSTSGPLLTKTINLVPSADNISKIKLYYPRIDDLRGLDNMYVTVK